jgi:hypothetical protein
MVARDPHTLPAQPVARFYLLRHGEADFDLPRRLGIKEWGVDLAPLIKRGKDQIRTAHLVALTRAGAKFENGVLIERPDESTSGDTHAA